MAIGAAGGGGGNGGYPSGMPAADLCGVPVFDPLAGDEQWSTDVEEMQAWSETARAAQSQGAWLAQAQERSEPGGAAASWEPSAPAMLLAATAASVGRLQGEAAVLRLAGGLGEAGADSASTSSAERHADVTRWALEEAGAVRAGGDDGGVTLAAKRTFTPRSCQQCRKGRRKCSQTRPCVQCVARGDGKDCCDDNAQQIHRPLSSAQTLQLTAVSGLVKARELMLPGWMGDFGAILLSRMGESGFPMDQMQNILLNLPPSVSTVLAEWFPVVCKAYAKRLCRAHEHHQHERAGAPQDPRSHPTIAGWNDHESSQEERMEELDQLAGHENWFSIVYDPVSGRRNAVHVGRGMAAMLGMHHEEFMARVAANDLPLLCSEVETLCHFLHTLIDSTYTASRVGFESSRISRMYRPTPTERARNDAKRQRRENDASTSSSPSPSDVSVPDTSSPLFLGTPTPPPASQRTTLEASGAGEGCGRRKKKPQSSIIVVRQRVIKVMDSLGRVRQIVFGFESVSEKDFTPSERPFAEAFADLPSYHEFLGDSAEDIHLRGKMGYWKRCKAVRKDMDRLSEVLARHMRLTCSRLANE